MLRESRHGIPQARVGLSSDLVPVHVRRCILAAQGDDVLHVRGCVLGEIAELLVIELRLADLRLGKVRSRNPVVPIDAKLDIDKLVARANVRLVLDAIVHPILPKERAVPVSYTHLSER